MKLGIRTKFIGILVIAAVIPLCLAIGAIWLLGNHYYRREKGELFRAGAMHLAQTLDLTLNKQIEELNDWMLLSDLRSRIKEINESPPNLRPDEFSARIRKIEARWPSLTERDPALREILNNRIAQQLKRFQSVCPLFAEIFVTDIKGQLVASTGKTTDYWQADEDWWREALPMAQGHVHVEGINFDESAGVYSVDVAIPIRSTDENSEQPMGVLKGVLNASPLFATAQKILGDETVVRLVVLDDGRILAGLFGVQIQPLQARIPEEAIPSLAKRRPGWMVVKPSGRPARLFGYAPLRLSGRLIGEAIPSGMKPLHVVVYDDLTTQMAPIRNQLWMLSGIGSVIVMGFVLVGLYIANRKIIAPIHLLRSAAQAVASSAKLEESAELEVADAPPDSVQSPEALRQVKQIQTADELEDLARDFYSMARRVLRYHEQLEEEIAAKTTEIQRDLLFAREFQEALMPRKFPQIPADSASDPLALNFHHVYQPTSSVGGDFFDVLKLSDHRAGIFIADVMGHGARSALVTAILRTLLQDFAEHAGDPARFLALINRHFYDIVQQSKQVVFVSAFYLIVDTQKCIATYASAGHPSPMLADRSRKKVATLVEHLEDNPALGLFRESAYTSFTSFIKKDDVFVLFTDGVVEATNPEGEQFGRERLCEVIARHINRDASGLDGAIMDAVNEFVQSSALADDICIVAVEVKAPAVARKVEPADAGATL